MFVCAKVSKAWNSGSKQWRQIQVKRAGGTQIEKWVFDFRWFAHTMNIMAHAHNHYQIIFQNYKNKCKMKNKRLFYYNKWKIQNRYYDCWTSLRINSLSLLIHSSICSVEPWIPQLANAWVSISSESARTPAVTPVSGDSTSVVRVASDDGTPAVTPVPGDRTPEAWAASDDRTRADWASSRDRTSAVSALQ